jgi:catechol 2,3-dioxygenase-like lactoylglutathione lyase family enzyme
MRNLQRHCQRTLLALLVLVGGTMDQGRAERPCDLRIAEIVYFVADVPASVEFYTGTLGWTKVSQHGDAYALVSALGRYNVALLAAKYGTEGWSAGQRVAPPQVSFQVDGDIEAAADFFREVGARIDGDVVVGEAMSNFSAVDPFGTQLFVWSDPGPLPSSPEPPDDGPYVFGEALVYVDNLRAAEGFYIGLMGLQVLQRHGDAYTAARYPGGFALGLMRWSEWFDKPAPGIPPAPPRLALECRNIAHEVERLQSKGVELELRRDQEGLEWATFTDPDGNPVSLWQYGRVYPIH